MKLTTPDAASLRTNLIQMLTSELRLPDGSVKSDRPFTEYGLDSIAALTIAGRLEEQLGVQLPSTLLWDCPTVDTLADYLASMISAEYSGSA